MGKSSYPGLSVVGGEEYRRLRFEVAHGSATIAPRLDDYVVHHGVAGQDDTAMACKVLAHELGGFKDDATRAGGGDPIASFNPKAAAATYEHLSTLPGDVLADRDFWRYLSVHVLFDVVSWVYPGDNGDRWGTNPNQFNRCAPLSLFVRGRLAAGCDGPARAAIDAVNDVDVWTSHVVAVSYGSAPQAVGPFMEAVLAWQDPRTGRLSGESRRKVRELSRLVTAARANFVFDLSDMATGREIVASLIPEAEQRALLRAARAADGSVDGGDDG
jgi:hypothetical protein